jgi:hypothetical protein
VPAKTVVIVRSKLGGKVLGEVNLPAKLGGSCTKSDFVKVVDDLQRDIAKFFVDSCRPARYLMIYVGQVCLTSPSYMFSKELGFPAEELEHQVQKLQKARLIDVMYNQDDRPALQRLAQRNVTVIYDERQHSLEVKEREPTNGHTERVALPEVEVYGFNGFKQLVTWISFHTYGARIAGLECFKSLQWLHVSVLCSEARWRRCDFESLSTIRLSKLSMYFDVYAEPEGLDLMTNLSELELSCFQEYYQHGDSGRINVPSDIGLLTNLKQLRLCGTGFNNPGSVLDKLRTHNTQIELEIFYSDDEEDTEDTQEEDIQEEEDEEETTKLTC